MSEKPTQVTDVDLGAPWPTHENFKAAVDAVSRSRRDQATADSQQLRGSSIQSYEFDGVRAALLMSTGASLTLEATATGVDWELTSRPAPPDPEAAPPDEMRLRFPQGHEYEWNWREWLQGLLGREFVALNPGETIVRLHVRDAPELLFDSLVNLGTGSRFLFFSES